MPLTAVSLDSSVHCFTGLPSRPGFYRSFGVRPSISPKPSRFFLCCKKVEVSEPKHFASSFNFSNEGAAVSKFRSANAKDIDVATLGNLCVDIVLNVPNLPPEDDDERKAYMERLSSSPPDKRYWEAGGNCNMAIAAARLGLRCATIGHVGNEIYGQFLLDVLHDEGISTVGMSNVSHVASSKTFYETLLCWVLVDPLQRHGFCSRADFSKEPAFSWINELSGEIKTTIRRSKVLFCNGYGFDELTPNFIISIVKYALEVGTSIFFDPGPRGKSLSVGTPDEISALGHFLRMSDALLLTSDEAESLTGIKDPILAGKELLKKGVRTKWVIVKMGPRGSILITKTGIACAPAFKVNVVDTVGCGDSFVAAIAYGYIHNLPTLDTLTIANAVGAATAMGCGAGRSVATLEKVLELMMKANINEDNDFWNELFSENLDSQEITIMSKSDVNGDNRPVNYVVLHKMLSRLLPMLEHAQYERKLTS
ncbi:fructokinase-1 [Cucurbita moschata]|uniref:Fructokinase-1 n=1 Tax=Cucurbita moschata TaxID=3662 RepID=A0A6J1H739_CUCMO|nr:fructokinase-1 [Cucurbita moschata]XP_022960247.1 fructokinase-1 [Cucurbita moschata]